MKHTLLSRILIGTVVAFAVPMAALADLNQTTTLQAGTSLNLDTGATASSGGDILWNGSSITPQGAATAVNIYIGLSVAQFNTITSILVSLLPGYSQATISATDLRIGNVFGVHTNGGHYAKVLVTANSGGAITLVSTTFGVTGGGNGGPPMISAILNNSSGIRAGMPNYGVAPSSLFKITGSGLADPGDATLHSSEGAGLPVTLNGTSLTVTAGALVLHPAMYYATPTQIDAVLPAAAPIGDWMLTVTRGATSATATIHVVASAVGFTQFNQVPVSDPNILNSNVAIGVATDLNGVLLTFTHSGSPGDTTMIVWGTGLGADPADSDTTYTGAPHAINTPMQLYFGGVLVTVLYQGASTYPGVDVIIFTIPASVPGGCYVPLIAVTGTVVSNVANFPIAKGGGTCFDITTGISGSQILQSTQDALRTGLVSLVQTNSPARGTTNTANAAFQKYNGLLGAATGLIVSPGGCTVGQLLPGDSLTLAGLDAGTITLAGPAGLAVTLAPQAGIKGAFSAALGGGTIPPSGGIFTFKGSGGMDVGSFTASLTLSNPIFAWTNPSGAASIDRTQPLTVTWTGGNPGTYIVIGGTSITPGGVNAGFLCRAAAEAGQFTVPAYILLGLPPGNGGVNLQNDIISSLTASGLDAGTAGATISYNAASTVR